MKAYFISDNIDTFVGLKATGIKGIVLHEREEILEHLEEVLKDKEITIIIMTEKIAMAIPEKVKEIKLSKYFPLLVEIPDRHGRMKEEDSMLGYVREAIGLKI